VAGARVCRRIDGPYCRVVSCVRHGHDSPGTLVDSCGGRGNLHHEREDLSTVAEYLRGGGVRGGLRVLHHERERALVRLHASGPPRCRYVLRSDQLRGHSMRDGLHLRRDRGECGMPVPGLARSHPGTLKSLKTNEKFARSEWK
jgi:hypothetical protein